MHLSPAFVISSPRGSTPCCVPHARVTYYNKDRDPCNDDRGKDVFAQHAACHLAIGGSIRAYLVSTGVEPHPGPVNAKTTINGRIHDEVPRSHEKETDQRDGLHVDDDHSDEARRGHDDVKNEDGALSQTRSPLALSDHAAEKRRAAEYGRRPGAAEPAESTSTEMLQTQRLGVAGSSCVRGIRAKMEGRPCRGRDGLQSTGVCEPSHPQPHPPDIGGRFKFDGKIEFENGAAIASEPFVDGPGNTEQSTEFENEVNFMCEPFGDGPAKIEQSGLFYAGGRMKRIER